MQQLAFHFVGNFMILGLYKYASPTVRHFWHFVKKKLQKVAGGGGNEGACNWQSHNITLDNIMPHPWTDLL